MSQLYITNARIILPDKVLSRGTILIKDRKISAIRQGKFACRGAAKIDARGDFVAPGFIDLHIHGDVERVSLQQVKGGTTGFLATLHPAKPRALLENIAQVLAREQEVRGAKVLGLRLEGPFLNRRFCGALPAEALRQPDINEARRIIKKGGRALKMVILAPELKKAPALIRFLRRHKIIASLGHTGATYEQAEKGIDAGIAHATHTFNRMGSFNHRAPGALGAVLTDERVACEIIPDGVHAHPAALKLLMHCKGLDRVMLITDSTEALTHPAKRRYADVFKLKDGTLYGTALTLNKALKNVMKFLGLDPSLKRNRKVYPLGLTLPEAVRLVTLNPAKVLKIEKRKGSIAAGRDADLVIFDKNFNVKMTIVEGKVVFRC